MVARVPGTAVFLTRTPHETPPVLSWHVAKNRSLHENVLAMTLIIEPTPRVDEGVAGQGAPGGRAFLARRGRGIGFMERPQIAAVLAQCERLGAEIDLDDVTYYVGH